MARSTPRAVPPTPTSLGYRMPAEWEPHAATWIAWPHNVTDWPGKFSAIPWVYAEIVRHLAEVERVEILVNSKAAERRARRVLRAAGAELGYVRFHPWPTNRGWTRDCGPIFLTRSPDSNPKEAPPLA
ncbi:MAG: agmatine deiminase family protein, partial [Terriglobales bacterium]